MSGLPGPDAHEREIEREVADLRPVLTGILPEGWDGPVRAGERVALDAGLRRAWLIVYHRARASVRDPREAEDVAQEVFSRVLARLATRGPDGVPIEPAYLARAARNLLYDQWRSRDRHRADEAAYAEDRSGAPAGPEDEALRRMEGEEVRVAFGALSPTQRQVLRLRIYEQLTAEETAAVVGRTPDWVRQVQHRALRTLREQLTRPDTAEADEP
ncbi:MAG TPA: sigma-70 family RNA polymerase sigma factor [Acidimicrobiales bacterium]|nr:sigma-70 family RNA polymerase sigma factor [Acidimicrobiales bacterium]